MECDLPQPHPIKFGAQQKSGASLAQSLDFVLLPAKQKIKDESKIKTGADFPLKENSRVEVV